MFRFWVGKAVRFSVMPGVTVCRSRSVSAFTSVKLAMLRAELMTEKLSVRGAPLSPVPSGPSKGEASSE
jgi:hypothetical protein